MTNPIGPTNPSGPPPRLRSSMSIETEIANFLSKMEKEGLSPDQLEAKTQEFKKQLDDKLNHGNSIFSQEKHQILQEFIDKPSPRDLATLKKDVVICEIKVQVLDRSGDQDIRKLKMDILDSLENLDKLYSNPDPRELMNKFQVIFNQSNNFNVAAPNSPSDFEHVKDVLKEFNTNTPTGYETPSQEDAESSLIEALNQLMDFH